MHADTLTCSQISILYTYTYCVCFKQHSIHSIYLSVRHSLLAVVKSHTNCRDFLTIPAVYKAQCNTLTPAVLYVQYVLYRTCILEFVEYLFEEDPTVFNVWISSGNIVPV